jgi:hypothetical protein
MRSAALFSLVALFLSSPSLYAQSFVQLLPVIDRVTAEQGIVVRDGRAGLRKPVGSAGLNLGGKGDLPKAVESPGDPFSFIESERARNWILDAGPSVDID